MAQDHGKAQGARTAGRGRAVAMARPTVRGLTGHALGLVLIALFVLLSACSPVYRNHGYVPVDEDLALIEVGQDTRETVAEKIGRPTALGLLNDVGWYYVQSRYKFYGPREPQEIDRQVVAVTFDEGGTVRNIERFGLEDGKVITISRRITETSIQEIGFIRQLLGNFGRIAPGSLLAD